MKNLQNVLEEIKGYGAYAISLMYGEDVGCDDSSEKQMARQMKIWWCPVGTTGEVRMCLKMSLKNILSKSIGDMRFNKINNPPKNNEIEKDGLYVWGTERTMRDIPANLQLKNWMKHLDLLLEDFKAEARTTPPKEG